MAKTDRHRCLQMRNLTSETASCHSKRENIALICEQNENRVHSRVSYNAKFTGPRGINTRETVVLVENTFHLTVCTKQIFRGIRSFSGKFFKETESESSETIQV